MRRGTALAALLAPAALALPACAPAARASSRVGGCPLFPRASPWHQRVDRLPVLPGSDRMVDAVGRGAPLHADFGAGRYAGGPIGIPYVVVPRRQRRVPVRFAYADESDRGPYPIPPRAPVEGGRAATGDRHVLVVAARDMPPLRALRRPPGRERGAPAWMAGGLRRDVVAALDTAAAFGWTSADAAGLPILPGLARWPEVRSGRIDHALRITVPRTRRAAILPARHVASGSADPDLPAMGERLRLKASVDRRRFPAQARVVLRALREYGGIVADNGSAWFVSGAPDRHWDDDALHALSRLTGDDLEVVDTGRPARTPDPTVPGRTSVVAPPAWHAGVRPAARPRRRLAGCAAPRSCSPRSLSRRAVVARDRLGVRPARRCGGPAAARRARPRGGRAPGGRPRARGPPARRQRQRPRGVLEGHALRDDLPARPAGPGADAPHRVERGAPAGLVVARRAGPRSLRRALPRPRRADRAAARSRGAGGRRRRPPGRVGRVARRARRDDVPARVGRRRSAGTAPRPGRPRTAARRAATPASARRCPRCWPRWRAFFADQGGVRRRFVAMWGHVARRLRPRRRGRRLRPPQRARRAGRRRAARALGRLRRRAGRDPAGAPARAGSSCSSRP